MIGCMWFACGIHPSSQPSIQVKYLATPGGTRCLTAIAFHYTATAGSLARLRMSHLKKRARDQPSPRLCRTGLRWAQPNRSPLHLELQYLWSIRASGTKTKRQTKSCYRVSHPLPNGRVVYLTQNLAQCQRGSIAAFISWHWLQLQLIEWEYRYP